MTHYEDIINYRKSNTLEPNISLDLIFKKIAETITVAAKTTDREPQKSWRAEKPAFLKKVSQNRDDILTADINTMLNKMSPKNFETITNSVVEILSKNSNNIKFFEFTIENIFMKAVTQAIYCKNYTEFIKILFDREFNVGDIVMEKCDKFKHILKEEEDTSRSYSKQVTTENYSKFCKDLKDKNYKRGYSQFIGEMYNKKLVSRDILSENIEICVSNVKKYLEIEPKGAAVEDNVICLIAIIKALEDQDIVTDYKESLVALQKSDNLPKRLMFMFMDLFKPKKK
jgi:hypothetical protein